MQSKCFKFVGSGINANPMKHATYIFFLLLLPWMGTAQETASVEKAIKSGKASELKPYFDANVELIILNEEGVYDPETAEKKLNTFFNAAKVVTFKVVHKGGSQGRPKYTIGELGTINGNFRLTFHYKDADGVVLITQFHIEEE
jgi:hypothetical protein